MPTRELITKEAKLRSKERLYQIWNELYWCRLDSALVLFLIQLYELALIIYTPCGDKANHRNIAKNYSGTNVSRLALLRNVLTHNLYSIEDIRGVVSKYIEDITQDVFIDICSTCNLDGIIVWETINNMCCSSETLSRNYTTPALLRLKTMQELTGECV